jgi:hypothetical protein
MAAAMDWPAAVGAADSIRAAAEFVRPELLGEASLTVGFALHEFRRGRVHGAVSVGPFECMPNRIAEAQFLHAREEYGLPSVTLSLNGDPSDPSPLDAFVYEVHRRYAAGETSCAATAGVPR